jgi:GntR family transcriptional regulator
MSTSKSEPTRYRALADALRQHIETGALLDNAALPSERDIAESYAVSRDTVRKALRYLEERGVIYSDQGRGTFVAPALVRRMSRFLDSFSQDTSARGGVAGQQIISIETIAASMAVAGLLGVAPGDRLIRIVRIRTVDAKVVGMHDTCLVALPVLAIDRAALEKSGSLYKLLSDGFGIVAAEAIENLSAAAATPEDAALLKVAPGSPLLVCERVTFSERRLPIEYCQMKYLPSYRYSSRVSKHGFEH